MKDCFTASFITQDAEPTKLKSEKNSKAQYFTSTPTATKFHCNTKP